MYIFQKFQSMSEMIFIIIYTYMYITHLHYYVVISFDKSYHLFYRPKVLLFTIKRIAVSVLQEFLCSLKAANCQPLLLGIYAYPLVQNNQ